LSASFVMPASLSPESPVRRVEGYLLGRRRALRRTNGGFAAATPGGCAPQNPGDSGDWTRKYWLKIGKLVPGGVGMRWGRMGTDGAGRSVTGRLNGARPGRGRWGDPGHGASSRFDGVSICYYMTFIQPGRPLPRCTIEVRPAST
jgi:hypothetical protein